MAHRYPSFWLTSAILVFGNAVADEKVAAYLIQLPESLSTVFVAETSTASFHRFDNASGEIRQNGSQRISIGVNGAGKQRAGDKRTPLGAYFVTEKLDTSRLHEKYGIVAFPLDYPNAWDRRLERTGDGIWVHGVDPRGGQRPVLDTDGCLALPNEELAKIVDIFTPNQTLVLITEQLEWSDPETLASLQSELVAAIDRWADSQANGNLHKYLSAYHRDFRRWQMDKEQWSSFVVQTHASRAITVVDIADLLLLRYPAEEGIYLSRFRQSTVEDGRQTTRMKRLYWRRDVTGEFRIIAESSG